MNKIKLLFLLLIFILITGCKQEYNLVISDSAIKEEFKAVVDNNDDNLKRLSVNYYPLHANDVVTYNKKIIKNNNYITAFFSYVYKPYDFVNANTFNQCFRNKKVIMDDKKVYEIVLSDFVDCMYDYNLDINIITNNKVISNNADEVKKNKYIWHLTEEKKDTFSIEIKIQKGTSKSIIQKYQFIIYIVIGIVVIGITLGVYITFKNHKKNNEI